MTNTPNESRSLENEQASGFRRRALVRGAAWAVPTVAVTAAAPAFAASTKPNDPQKPIPPAPVDEPCTKEWAECVSLRYDGSQIARTAKDWTDCTDVAIDAWADVVRAKNGRIIGYRPVFRIIVGTMMDQTNVTAKLTVDRKSVTLVNIGSLQSPALAATPCAYRENIITPGQPVLAADGKSVEWPIGDMPAKSSAMFYAYGAKRMLSSCDTSPYRLKLKVKGTYKCEDLYEGECPQQRTNCA